MHIDRYQRVCFFGLDGRNFQQVIKCLNKEFFLVRMQENVDQKKLRIWTLFTQCFHYINIPKKNYTLRIIDLIKA